MTLILKIVIKIAIFIFYLNIQRINSGGKDKKKWITISVGRKNLENCF